MEKFIIDTTVGLYTLIVVDLIKSCCSENYGRPEIGITFNRIRQMVPKLKTFTDAYRRLGGKIIWVKTTP